jgi:hypothetical protein
MKTGLALLLFLTLPPLDARAGAAGDCAGEKPVGQEVRLGGVDDRLEIRLVDGRKVFFPTLEPPRATSAAPDRPREVAAELTALLAGKPLILHQLGAEDRWGRIPARLFLAGDSESADETLAAAGLVIAGLQGGACAARVRAAEAQARADRLGLWADPDLAVVNADAPTDWARRAGALVVVEGRIANIGRTPPRLYLNLGARRGGLSLTIARRNLPLFERAGLGEADLLHKALRARGVVELGAGPQIELFDPQQIEILDGGR